MSSVKSPYYEKYLKNGQDLFETYCSTDDSRSIMLPRAPKQTYIDVYPDRDEPGCSFDNDIQQQLNYEAEVKFYRALEKLDKGLIVLHGFECTHYQYHLGDTNHDKRGCSKCKKLATKNSLEGECDFVVIAPNYFVIIEVKNMTHIGKESLSESEKEKRLQALSGTFQKSIGQRRKMFELIKRFSDRLNVLQFTVYPNFDRSFKDEFRISRDDESTLILKEDLLDICNWWEENVSDYMMDEPLHPEFRQKQLEVRNMLLAIWCTDRNTCDMEKGSLGKTIMNISKKLRSAQFTFRSNNPNVQPAPQFVKDYLGIDNLTKEQHDLINSTEKFMFITGPAGSGKTVVLLVKILELVLSSKDNKVVLFHYTDSSKHLSKPLEKAGVTYVSLDNVWIHTNRDGFQFIPLITDHLMNSQVVIVGVSGSDCEVRLSHTRKAGANFKIIEYWLQFIVTWGVNVFVDDGLMQNEGFVADTPEKRLICEHPLYHMMEKSNSRHFWAAYDLIQKETSCVEIDRLGNYKHIGIADAFDDITASGPSLSKCLRNTHDLSKVLSVLRNRLIEMIEQEHDVKPHLCPVQTIGHYIHGPKAVVHVLKNYNQKKICDIVSKEVHKLLCEYSGLTTELGRADVGVIYSGEDEDTLSVVECVSQLLDIKPKEIRSVLSLEWPAVVSILCVSDNFFDNFQRTSFGYLEDRLNSYADISNMYLAASRARVKCTIIIYPLEGFIFDERSVVGNLLGELENLVELRKHPLTPLSYRPRPLTDLNSFINYFKEKFPKLFRIFDSLSETELMVIRQLISDRIKCANPRS